MSTISTIKAALNSIISKANAATGGADATVAAAVDRLVSGYGSGSGGGGSAQGLNARLYTITLDTDKTANVTLMQNDWLKSLRENPGAFVLMRYMGVEASKAMMPFWITANFTIFYDGDTAYNSIIVRATDSTAGFNSNVNGLPGDNYSGHLNIDPSGSLWAIPSSTYPIKAGTYQIVAGTMEML